MPTPEYLEVLSAFEKRLGEMEAKDLEALAGSLSRRGVFASPYGVKPEVEMREKYAGIATEKIAEMNLGEYLREISRKQQLEDMAKQRQWQKEDLAEQERVAKEIAAMYQPKKKEWWEDAIGAVATGAGYALGGPLGAAGVEGVKGWFGKKTPS